MKNIENKINIINLIEDYSKLKSEKLKEDYLKSKIQIKDYVEYGKKMFYAEQIVEASCLSNGYIHVDSCKKYILYIYTLISIYTNLDIEENDFLHQYDLLDKYNLIDEILNMISSKELATFKTILEMKQNDLITNKYETHAYITEKLNVYSKAFEPLLNKLTEKVDSLDEKSINNITNKMVNLIKLLK